MKSRLYLSFSSIAILFSIVCFDAPPVQPTEQYYSVIKPAIDTGFPFNIEQDSLVYKSSLVRLGTLNLKSYGICYGQKQNPTVSDKVDISKTAIDTLPFFFDNKVKNLSIGTTYQVRSFVITSKDTIYGVNNFFRTPGRNEWFLRFRALPGFANTAFDDRKIYTLSNDNRLFEYDTRQFSWSEKKLLPSTLSGGTSKYSFMTNGKVYCGNLLKTANKLESEFWEYDPLTNSWRNLATNKPNIESLSSFGFTDKKMGMF